MVLESGSVIDIRLAGADIGDARDLVAWRGEDRFAGQAVAVVVDEIGDDAVRVGDLRRLAGAVGGVDRGRVRELVGDAGQRAGGIGVGVFDRGPGARECLGQQLAGAL